MKKLLVVSACLGLFLVAAKPAGAVFETSCCKINCEKLNKYPHTVACYESGDHGIPGQSETHTGADVVKSYFNGKFLYQFFCGTSASQGLHREISLWKVTKNKKCATGWLLYENPYPAWGDYLIPDADYCIKTITLPCPTCKKDKPCKCGEFQMPDMSATLGVNTTD